MLKRVVAVLICAVMLSALMPIANITDTAFASDYSFDERIMYGGVAVDVDDDVVYNENGALYRKNSDGEVEKIAEVDGKYLNYYKNKLFFVNGNKIMSCNPDGSGMFTVLEFQTEIKCFYVGDFGMMYLKNDTVFVNENGVEKAVLTLTPESFPILPARAEIISCGASIAILIIFIFLSRYGIPILPIIYFPHS